MYHVGMHRVSEDEQERALETLKYHFFYLSGSEYTATVLIPSFLAVRMILHAISPLFAINILLNSGNF